MPAPRPKPVPFPFVLEALEPLSPRTRPMFSCLAVYVGRKIVLALRDRPTPIVPRSPGLGLRGPRAGASRSGARGAATQGPAPRKDNGVWLATTRDHHASLREDFPSMRSIAVLGEGVTAWQLLPADAADFEESALRACDLIARGDPRIGKIPAAKRRQS